MNKTRNLIIYFSVSGNTEKLAHRIQQEIGGTLKQLEPTSEYPKDSYEALSERAKKEKDENVRPEYKDLEIDLDNFDNIFIGYPIWWYTLPMILRRLFDDYDFSEKKIIPFNTHEGSGDGETWELIKELEPKANVLEGLAVHGGEVEDFPKETLENWLSELNL